jgi:hypothetical protein
MQEVRELAESLLAACNENQEALAKHIVEELLGTHAKHKEFLHLAANISDIHGAPVATSETGSEVCGIFMNAYARTFLFVSACMPTCTHSVRRHARI